MIAGAPSEARWYRPEPRLFLPRPLVERIARDAFPHCRVSEVRPFPDGYRNANFKLQLEALPEPFASTSTIPRFARKKQPCFVSSPAPFLFRK